jgi:hypothetical protein
MMIEILGVDVYIGFIAVGIGILCMTALVIAGHIDSKRAGK